MHPRARWLILRGNAGFGGDQDRQITTDNTGIQFELEEINYIENSDWYYNCKASSYTFRPAHVRDTSKYLNVFTCSGDGYLGWTWLPWTHGEGSNMQAVIVNQNSLPGGTFSKYSLGYTLVHETGHYFGLLHTFARGVCTGVGDDGVDDTPLEARGGSSCGTNFDDYTRDTCTNDPGADPLWSFMDYSYDQCMQRFSAGQVARMREMTDLHRPGLVANSFAGYLNSAPATSAPTAQPTDAPTDAPTTRSPTAVPTNSPTAGPTVESSIVITSHSTKLYQSQTGVVSINYQCVCARRPPARSHVPRAVSCLRPPIFFVYSSEIESPPVARLVSMQALTGGSLTHPPPQVLDTAAAGGQGRGAQRGRALGRRVGGDPAPTLVAPDGHGDDRPHHHPPRQALCRQELQGLGLADARGRPPQGRALDAPHVLRSLRHTARGRCGYCRRR